MTVQWQEVLLVAFSLLLLAGLPSSWRGSRRWSSKPPVMWLWDDVTWRGMLRMYPIGTATFGLGSAAVVGEHVDRALGITLLYPSLMGAATVATVLTCTVFLRNKPRWLIPPRLRDQPSTIEEWQSRRAGWLEPPPPR